MNDLVEAVPGFDNSWWVRSSGTPEDDRRSSARWKEYERIADVVPRAGRTLDWGCGSGRIAKLLQDAGHDVLPFAFVPGFEPSALSNRPAFAPGLRVCVSSDPVRLPFVDDSFDTVLSIGVLEHVQDPIASLREIHRVLSPTGRLRIFKLPNRWSLMEAAARALRMPHHGDGRWPYDALYTRWLASQTLRIAGFEVEHFAYTNMLPLGPLHRLGRRGADLAWRSNLALERVPLLNRLATDFTVVCRPVDTLALRTRHGSVPVHGWEGKRPA